MKQKDLIRLSLRAYQIESEASRGQQQVQVNVEEGPWPEIKDNHLLVQICYSGLNYKDALGLTGQGNIFKSFPLIPGIDASGIVIQSKSSLWKEGDEVLITGQGFGETRDGGYTTVALIPEQLPIKCPPHLSLRESMMLGTAGFTSALCWLRMHHNGQTPRQGPLLITGASGGVGSLSLKLFSSSGYQVTALTSHQSHKDYLQKMGAHQVMTLQDFLSTKLYPLSKSCWGGGIDNVGGEVLTRLLSQTSLGGNVCSVGLALKTDFQSSVMPFILRGVSLIGISSTNAPRSWREEAWELLGEKSYLLCHSDLRVKEIALLDVPDYAKEMLKGQHQGRFLVKIS
jgi:acrylyl-CoA reductase (NADPH)